MNVPSSAVTISPILVLTYVLIVFVKRTNGIIQSLKQQCGHGDYSPVDDFRSDCHSDNLWQFSSMPFYYSTLVPMFTVLNPLLEFTYHLLFSWRKFALCIQSLLCMLFVFGWPPCQRSDMSLMEVSQYVYDMIHYISGLFGYFYVCEIYVNLIWYLYLFMLNKFCLSLSQIQMIIITDYIICFWVQRVIGNFNLLMAM